MPNYRYLASTGRGKTQRGEMIAPDTITLRELLQEKELYLLSARETRQASGTTRLKPRQLADFCRELSSMVGAGIPLARALSIMADRDIAAGPKKVYQNVYRSVRLGKMLSEAMEEEGAAFPELLINMVRSGETTGNMEGTLQNMAVHYEKSYKLAKKVSSAMTYPIILACITLVVLLIVFLVVLPKFFQIFEEMNAELPALTQFMLNLSTGLRDNWVWLLMGVLGVVLLWNILLQVRSVRRVRDMIRLKLPVVGHLLQIIYTARFARVMASTYASGLSVVNALVNARETVGNLYVSDQFDRMIQSVRNGESLSAAIGTIRGFDRKLSSTVMIGEETGRLDSMLNAMADSFDYESEMALAKLTAMVEPIMIVIMAVIVGSVILSVMMSLTSLYTAIGG